MSLSGLQSVFSQMELGISKTQINVYFMCMSALSHYVQHEKIVSMESRRGSWSSLELELQIDMRHHLGAGN